MATAQRETVGDCKFTITNIFVALLSKQRYYAAVVSKMAKIPSKQVDTLGVSFNRYGKVILVYNPDFINKCTLLEAIDCLTHEALHVFFRHLTRFDMKSATPKMRQLFNIACDITINQYLNNLPLGKAKFEGSKMVEGGAFYPETFNFPKDKSADWYLAELLKIFKDEETPQNGKGESKKGDKGEKGDASDPQEPSKDGTLDDHSVWGKVFDEGEKGKEEGQFKDAGEFDIDPEYEMDKFIKEVVKDMTKQKGDMPAWMKKELDAIKAEKRHDWKHTLKIFVNSMLAVDKKLSTKRVNKRFVEQEYILPGKKKDNRPRILVARDTSGSMYADDIQKELLNEMIAISKQCDMYVVDCDTEIHQDYHVKRIDDFKKYEGGGGTSFKPVFEYAKTKNFDGVIYLTDTCGDFPKKEDLRRKLISKTIWVTFDQEKVELPFGKHLNISTK